jgi:HlyD family secretion protein
VFLWSLGATVLLAGAAYGVWWWKFRDTLHYVTARVTRGDIRRSINMTGALNPVVTAQVGSFVSGNIKSWSCDYNTQVKIGQQCALIDPLPFQVVVDEDEADVRTSKAQLVKDKAAAANARIVYERDKQLRDQGIVSQETLDADKSTFDEDVATIDLDKATIASKEAALHAAQVNLAYTNIVSPVNGTVITRYIDVGYTVVSNLQSSTLFLIGKDMTKMQVDTNVSEADVGEVHDGQKATFSVQAFPNRTFEASVRQVRKGPITVQNVVTYDVVLDVDNRDLALMPGMTSDTHIITAERKNVLRVPLPATRFVPEGMTRGGRGSDGGRQGAGGVRGGGASGGGGSGNGVGGGAGRGNDVGASGVSGGGAGGGVSDGGDGTGGAGTSGSGAGARGGGRERDSGADRDDVADERLASVAESGVSGRGDASQDAAGQNGAGQAGRTAGSGGTNDGLAGAGPPSAGGGGADDQQRRHHWNREHGAAAAAAAKADSGDAGAGGSTAGGASGGGASAGAANGGGASVGGGAGAGSASDQNSDGQRHHRLNRDQANRNQLSANASGPRSPGATPDSASSSHASAADAGSSGGTSAPGAGAIGATASAWNGGTSGPGAGANGIGGTRAADATHGNAGGPAGGGAPGARRNRGPRGVARIWVLRNGQLMPITVRTGLDDGTLIEVWSEDLKEGDEVVVNAVRPNAPRPAAGDRPTGASGQGQPNGRAGGAGFRL